MDDNVLDEYARSRQRMNDLAPVEEIVGPHVANEIGNLQQAEYATKKAQGQDGQVKSGWDYITGPVGAGLDLLHGFSSRFRGLIAKKAWEPATGADVTGLDDEVITPEMQKEILTGSWYHQAFPALMLPKRTVNLLAETITDPFMLLGAGGATGVAAKGLKGKPAPVKGPKEPPPVPGQGAPESSSGASATGDLKPSPTPGEKSSPEGRASSTEPVQQPLFAETLYAKQLEEADKLGVPVRLVESPKLEPGTDHAQTFIEGFGRFLFEKQEMASVEGKQLHIKHAPEVKKEGTQLSLSPHTPREPVGTEKISTRTEAVKAGEVSGKQLTLDTAGEAQKPGQMGLPGIARPNIEYDKLGLTNTQKGFGFRKDENGVWQMVAKGSTRFEEVGGKQLKLALEETIDLSDKLRRMRQHVDEATVNDAQRRAIATHLIDSHAATPWSIIAKAKEQTKFPDEALVVAESAINRSVVEDVGKAFEAWEKSPGSEGAKEKAIAELAFFFDVNKSLLAAKASRGAVLRAERTSQDPAVKSMQDFFTNMAEGTTLERAAYAFKEMRTTQEKVNLLKGITGVGPVKGTIMQHMLNGLISSTGTPIWNFAAGTSLFGAKVFERWRMEGFKDAGIAKGGAGVMAWAFTKSYIDLLAAGYKRGKDLTPGQAGALGRFKEGIESAKEVFTGTPGEEIGKLNLRRSISAKNYGMEDSWFSPAIDYYGHFINIPSFMVGSSDAFLKFAVKQAAMETRAFDEASAEIAAQMKFGKEINKADAGKLVQARREQLMQRPSDTLLPHPETGVMTPLSETGDEMANLMSMMTQLKKGTVGQSIDAATHNSMLFRAIMPFFRVSYLSGREALIRTPILARLAPSVKADLEAGGYRAAKANAQMSTGYALATVGASMAALGFLEGDGPTDPDAAKLWRLNHSPGTLGIPGSKESRIPYTRLGPLGQVLRFMANGTELLSRLPDSEVSGEIVNGTAATLASLLVDPNFNKDMNDLFGALSTRDETGLSRWVEHKATMPLPYSALLRQVNRQLQGETQTADGILQKAAMLVPGYNGITYYNELGQRDVVPTDTAWDGLMNNAGFSNKADLDVKTQDVLDRLDLDRVTFNGPTRTHGGVRMDVAEFMNLRKQFGEVKIGGKTLIEGLDHLIQSPMYQRGIAGPGKSRQTMVTNLAGNYHQAAFRAFLNEKKDGAYIHEAFRKAYQDTRADEYILQTPGIQ